MPKKNITKRSDFMNRLVNVYEKHEEVIIYLIVGVMTTILNLVIYYGCVFTVLNPEDKLELQIANLIAWTVGVIFAYFMNRKYVFKSKNIDIKKEATKFLSSRVVTLLMDMSIMFFTVSILRFNDKIMKIFSNILVIILNYIFSKLLVFKKDR